MNLQLSESINEYFAASNNKDITKIRNCFSQNAVVTDEGQTYRGQTAIQNWMQEAQTKYEYTVNPLSAEAEKDRVIVTANVVGNFPGNSVNLHYAFLLNENNIQSLEIY